jgi:hypothetical protein
MEYPPVGNAMNSARSKKAGNALNRIMAHLLLSEIKVCLEPVKEKVPVWSFLWYMKTESQKRKEEA